MERGFSIREENGVFGVYTVNANGFEIEFNVKFNTFNEALEAVKNHPSTKNLF